MKFFFETPSQLQVLSQCFLETDSLAQDGPETS
jgi:hypothetical protein